MRIFNGMVFCFLALLFVSTSAYAVAFGKHDNLHKIQEITGNSLKINNEPVYLGYRTTAHFFLAGVYLKDQGYIISSNRDPKKYYQLNDEKIKKLQAGGFLPTPLPKYKIPIFDYIFGYSLWICIFCVGMYNFSKSLYSKSVLQYEGKHRIKSTRKW